MKNIESEIFEKIKALEEIKTKIKRIKYKKKKEKKSFGIKLMMKKHLKDKDWK